MKRLIIMAAVFAFILTVFTTTGWSVDKSIQLKVDGMTCDMCPPAVSKALKGVEGVKSAEVSLENGRAVVIAEEGVNTDDLLKAVETAGNFKAQLVEE